MGPRCASSWEPDKIKALTEVAGVVISPYGQTKAKKNGARLWAP
jgi:hypothetical protein